MHNFYLLVFIIEKNDPWLNVQISYKYNILNYTKQKVTGLYRINFKKKMMDSRWLCIMYEK